MQITRFGWKSKTKLNLNIILERSFLKFTLSLSSLLSAKSLDVIFQQVKFTATLASLNFKSSFNLKTRSLPIIVPLNDHSFLEIEFNPSGLNIFSTVITPMMHTIPRLKYGVVGKARHGPHPMGISWPSRGSRRFQPARGKRCRYLRGSRLRGNAFVRRTPTRTKPTSEKREGVGMDGRGREGKGRGQSCGYPDPMAHAVRGTDRWNRF